ncbi:mycofactocin biosynthesis glycosyltransferase MftF [Micromonospora sp. CPCC 205711]|uniref:mycofactocin biosynthesis glycosyltransferase MftF n=1 Tax=Micromonospora sp. CPCC 205547 TaxID=3122400 RepID=UPI002FF0A1B0
MTGDILYLDADPGVRRLGDGRVLLGGSPLRVLRLSDPAARLVHGWWAGDPVGPAPRHRALADRLVDAGLAHPRRESGGPTAADVTAVVPVRDHAAALARLLPALDGLATVVVDDGSRTPLPGATVRHDRPRGAAAARNTGWRLAGTDLVAFLDADVTPEPGWLDPLLRHFADPRVVAVAPRVCSTAGPTLLQRYERARPSLDMGEVGAVVRPWSRVPYLPTATLLVRVSALKELDGFAEDMLVGEDVDLVWRLVAGGGRVRYEPASRVRHATRPDWRAWARQRFTYGSSAAPLALRHGTAVTPVKVSPWSGVAWAAIALGRPRAGLAVAGVTAALLPRKLAAVGVPAGESLRLAVLGHLGAGRLLADALVRAWGPVAVPGLLASRRGRLVLAAVLARHVRDWQRQRPDVDLLRWVALRLADDLTHGAGVCWGALRHRTLAPLLPDLAGWPGRDGVDERPADPRAAGESGR